MSETANHQDQPIIACITVGELAENCYLFACPKTREAVIIDPGDEAERILNAIKELQITPKYILNTHGHYDHICAIDAVSEVYPVPLAIHSADLYMYTDADTARMLGKEGPLVKRKPDMLLKEGDRFTIGTLSLEVIETPGHSPGGVSFLCPEYCIFSGDTLFYRGIGRTDLPGGDYEQIVHSIRTKLYTLPEDLAVFPGHGEPTSIEEEKYENPFVSLD
ncbi:glyoxylase-like metal-dependent hydrolase (beta-lactamase superfamily II) [Thermosporothrix hazakensis]|uniref:Glyoxylase-like metal-dependent hydrolase (Beta-lactamase superfamily II) n=2 Tax=Thermosporothrix TaxID=768650 RepID=A0A326U520_THEHA|nr:MBL fold metallo-hydrolase [Thermosporothrix hazakensis]PZW24706.1 glyoxylase-like metal-dependent hydrolase (beta-lactamase superfamily II) [Thermosporothrix hazakensis]BBH90311.1 MBL fold metallo-hydrolase [Thermosporothrix sp. COM3]GCE48348.1 MBL fold metallo-hydrolase [Thermosporothrix hazakensis]